MGIQARVGSRDELAQRRDWSLGYPHRDDRQSFFPRRGGRSGALRRRDAYAAGAPARFVRRISPHDSADRGLDGRRAHGAQSEGPDRFRKRPGRADVRSHRQTAGPLVPRGCPQAVARRRIRPRHRRRGFHRSNPWCGPAAPINTSRSGSFRFTAQDNRGAVAPFIDVSQIERLQRVRKEFLDDFGTRSGRRWQAFVRPLRRWRISCPGKKRSSCAR